MSRAKRKAKAERPPFVPRGTPLEQRLAAVLKEASDHLDYCNYGDKWERECANDVPDPLDKKIEAALALAYEAGVLEGGSS